MRKNNIYLELALSIILILISTIVFADDDDGFYISTSPLKVTSPGAPSKTFTLPKDTPFRTRLQLARVLNQDSDPTNDLPADKVFVQILSPLKDKRFSREAIYILPKDALRTGAVSCNAPVLLKSAKNALEALSGPQLECTVPPHDLTWTKAKMQEFVTSADFNPLGLEIISREKWGAKNPKGELTPMPKPKGIVIHHTAGYSKRQNPNSIQDLHMNTKNWNDVGYHYMILQEPRSGVWKIYLGRKLSKDSLTGKDLLNQGAHTGGNSAQPNLNDGQIGVAIAGNYQAVSGENLGGHLLDAPESEQQPPPEAVLLLGKLIQKLKTDHPGITAIYGHGQGSLAINPGHSDCPGDGCLELVDAMKGRFIK